jgi:hypothetical protein
LAGAPGFPVNVRDWRKFVPPAGMGIGAEVSVTVTVHDGSNTQFTAGAPTLTIVNGVAQPVMKSKTAATATPLTSTNPPILI